MKFIPTAFLGPLSRSAGSTTASHNRNGYYLRNRVIPTDPATALQLLQRAAIVDFSQGWSAMTDAQRAAWTSLGLNMVRQDSLGADYTLTGLQAFTSVNRELRRIAGTELTTAPALAIPTAVASITPTALAS